MATSVTTIIPAPRRRVPAPPVCYAMPAPAGLAERRVGPGRPDDDQAIRGMHRLYFTARADEDRICAEPIPPAGSADGARQEEALSEAVVRASDAIDAVGKLKAATLDGARLKAEMFSAAAQENLLAGAFEIEPTNPEIRLALSICADLVRLVPGAGERS